LRINKKESRMKLSFLVFILLVVAVSIVPEVQRLYFPKMTSSNHLQMEEIENRQNFLRRKSLCLKGESSECMNVAQMFLNGTGTTQDFKEAQLYFEKACKRKNVLGCDKSVEIEKVNHDVQVCDMNDSESCYKLGLNFSLGKTVPRDNILAIKYFEKSCDLENSWGCEGLGMALIWQGLIEDSKSVRLQTGPKKERIINLYKKACDLDNSRACYNLGDYYARGIHVEQNLKSGFESFEKSCELSSDYGCFRLGNLYEEGLYVKKDLKKSNKIYKKACALQSHEACKKLIKI